MINPPKMSEFYFNIQFISLNPELYSDHKPFHPFTFKNYLHNVLLCIVLSTRKWSSSTKLTEDIKAVTTERQVSPKHEHVMPEQLNNGSSHVRSQYFTHVTVYSTIWQKLIPWTVVVQLLHKCSSEKSRSPSFICSRRRVQAQRPHICPCSCLEQEVRTALEWEAWSSHTGHDWTVHAVRNVWGTKLRLRLLLLMWGICPFEVQHWITALCCVFLHLFGHRKIKHRAVIKGTSRMWNVTFVSCSKFNSRMCLCHIIYTHEYRTMFTAHQQLSQKL